MYRPERRIWRQAYRVHSRGIYGTNTLNRYTANTTMCTSPNRMLVRPVPAVLRKNEQQQHHALTVEPQHEFLVERVAMTAVMVSPMVASDGSEREIDALLQIVVARSCGGDSLRKWHQERDQHAGERR